MSDLVGNPEHRISGVAAHNTVRFFPLQLSEMIKFTRLLILGLILPLAKVDLKLDGR